MLKKKVTSSRMPQLKKLFLIGRNCFTILHWFLLYIASGFKCSLLDLKKERERVERENWHQ